MNRFALDLNQSKVSQPVAGFLFGRRTRLDLGTAFGNSPSVPDPSASERELLTTLLEQVSRSFYQTLRKLPCQVRRQIGLAYLLARTTDTIADTELIPVAQRLTALQRLRGRILGTNSAGLDFSDLARHQGSPAERILLERAEETLTLLSALASDDLKLIRQVLDIITSGQELDLQRFAGAVKGRLVALQTDAELDDYTFRVAGCVGEFWTRICRAHLFPTARLDETRLETDGVRFGKGLQLVNILRDLPVDLRKGRCYLPEQPLSKAGLTPTDLLQPSNMKIFRLVYDRYLDLAESHLAAGWAYTNILPWRCARLRLACALPILIGVKTIALLRAANVLDPQHRVKIHRAEVRNLVVRSLLTYPLPRAWRRLANLPHAAAGKAVAPRANLT